MIKQIISVGIVMLFPLNLLAGQILVRCQNGPIVFEKYNGTEPVVQGMEREQLILINEDEFPPYKYPEQLSCQNGKLIFDPNFKPQYAIAAEQKQEQIKQAQAALDAELGKAEPDIITVMRLQRAIEQLKEDKKVSFVK